MKNKFSKVFFNAIPALIMIGLIPIVRNDYILAGCYILIITISMAIRKNKGDVLIFLFGFFIMIGSEYIFTSTGVETFNRNSLFGLMPIWLPFLWGYCFIAIAVGVRAFNWMK
jgi:hypothetical protein